jgi:hypothetical protein
MTRCQALIFALCSLTAAGGTTLDAAPGAPQATGPPGSAAAVRRNDDAQPRRAPAAARLDRQLWGRGRRAPRSPRPSGGGASCSRWRTYRWRRPWWHRGGRRRAAGDDLG